jgi:hypothetical protein
VSSADQIVYEAAACVVMVGACPRDAGRAKRGANHAPHVAVLDALALGPATCDLRAMQISKPRLALDYHLHYCQMHYDAISKTHLQFRADSQFALARVSALLTEPPLRHRDERLPQIVEGGVYRYVGIL